MSIRRARKTLPMSTTAPASGDMATPPVSDSLGICLTWPGVSGFDVSESKRTVCEPA